MFSGLAVSIRMSILLSRLRTRHPECFPNGSGKIPELGKFDHPSKTEKPGMPSA
jgi:hypothetical protein